MGLTLLAQLGVPGGQATVFSAQTADGEIAVKVYLEKSEHHLRDELAILSAVQGHRNVVKCLGDDMLESVPPPKPPSYAKHCLKLVLAKGGDMFNRAFPRSGARLSIEDVQGFAQQMVEGVTHIHSLGYAHLDIKPENMLLDANGTLMIADFGLARQMPVVAIPGDPFPGTHQFMAPELTNSGALKLTAPVNGYAVDVWAIGATMLMLSISLNPFALGADVKKPEERAKLTAVLRLTKKAQDANKNGVDAACDYFDDKRGRDAFRQLPEGLQDLLNGMLYVDPALRLTIQQVAEHPWLAVAAPVGPAAAAPAPAVQTATTDAGLVAPAGVAPVVAANVTAAAGQGPGYTSLAAAPAPVTAAYRGLSAADDEAEAPRYNSCGASAASYRGASSHAPDVVQFPPLMRANAGMHMLG